ncbi:hypothetical protein F6X54_10100 [Micromonospora aurantiaca]|uniref:Uncharacterized protein n=1 Tax=Micromonospora aurantiaca (nom. illeg.) TaxID=47850 RepID=A0ABQ6UIW3_9ACTN|nr:hypothetical protein [Micromonospora aurantiaca]KAB1116827.1 hypothetical protein F6X54_10100 [Micromonospora aurantiaca]
MTTPRIARWLEHIAAKLRTTEDDDSLPLLLLVPGVIIGVPMLFYAGFVISKHAEAYMQAGVPHDEAYAGAVTSQVLAVLALTATVAVAHRGLHRPLRVVASIAAGFAAVFAVLPYAVAGQSPLTILLSLLTALLFNLVFAAMLGLVVLRFDPPYREQPNTPTDASVTDLSSAR